MDILIKSHSGLRWVVLALLIFSVINAFNKKAKFSFEEGDRKLYLFTMIFTHIQLLIGLALYFVSPKVQFSAQTMSTKVLRYFTVEHTLIMLIAIALITIGHSKMKRAELPSKKNSAIALFYGIALILILIAIPWPFREGLGGSWG